jgi:hypothetical protein
MEYVTIYQQHFEKNSIPSAFPIMQLSLRYFNQSKLVSAAQQFCSFFLEQLSNFVLRDMAFKYISI